MPFGFPGSTPVKFAAGNSRVTEAGIGPGHVRAWAAPMRLLDVRALDLGSACEPGDSALCLFGLWSLLQALPAPVLPGGAACPGQLHWLIQREAVQKHPGGFVLGSSREGLYFPLFCPYNVRPQRCCMRVLLSSKCRCTS